MVGGIGIGVGHGFVVQEGRIGGSVGKMLEGSVFVWRFGKGRRSDGPRVETSCSLK